MKHILKWSCKDRISLLTLFIYIIGITGGCSSDEIKQTEVIQDSLKSSEIDGQWVGVVNGMDGNPLELNYRFRAEGGRLLGLIESRLGGGQITEGNIDGNNIEFKLNAGEGILIINNGTLSEDEIHMTQTVDKEKSSYILKRIKYNK